MDGHSRLADLDDLDLLVEWHHGFVETIGWPAVADPAAAFTRRIEDADGDVVIWQTEQPVAMAMTAISQADAGRIGHVYTPGEHRRRGFGAAVTAAAAQAIMASGCSRCLLLTQLANAGSNRIYRGLGFEGVEEVLIYQLSSGAKS